MDPDRPTPSEFVGRNFNPFVFVSSVVPAYFVGAKIVGFNIVPQPLADVSIGIMGHVWPVLPAHYDAIKRLASIAEAASYALFFMCLVLVGITFFAKFLAAYMRERARIRSTGWKDLLLVSVTMASSYYALFYDLPKANPKPMFNFYVDVVGLYYVRQYVLFVSVYVTVQLGLVALLKLADRRRRSSA